MARKPLTTKAAAVSVLRKHGGGPLPIKQIIEEALPLTAVKAQAPAQVVYSVVYTTAKKGDTFVKTGKGMIALLPEADVAPAEDGKPAEAKPARRAAKPATPRKRAAKAAN